jgi:adenosylcobyric acid synthase
MDLTSREGGAFKIAVPRLSRIANFDDLDPLAAEANVTVDIIESGRPLPADADLVLIPGTKSTIADLAYFRTQGWDIDLHAHIRRGGAVLGICGGYQMLGREIIDDAGLEGTPSRVVGLGHLNISTVMKPQKRLALTSATHTASGCTVSGYEIHLGVTSGPDCDAAWLDIGGRPEGASQGRVQGCYLHGIFASDAFRAAYLAQLGAPVDLRDHGRDVEDTLDALAAHLERHLDLDQLLALAQDV